MRRAVLAVWLLGAPLWIMGETVTVIRNNGPSANRIDYVILGDGYTAAEMGKFAADVENFVLSVFNQEPFKEYANYFNVLRVDVVSNESGADKPASGIYKDTALDATFYCSQIQRLICVSVSKVYDALNRSGIAADQKDLILVLVNDAEYGGSGGALAVASTHPSCVELILHETGHSFGLLADEYDYGTCNSSSEPSAPNATKETDRAKIKWNAGGGPPAGWIDPSTPLPTTGTASGIPGLYLGAVYCPTGLYRPTYNSKMRNLGQPFEQINQEQLVKRFYSYVSGLDSVSPDASVVDLALGEKKTFQITRMQPFSHALSAAWRLDGILLNTGSEITLDSSGGTYGSHQLTVEVHDPTSWVRNDPAVALTDSRTWTVRGYFSTVLPQTIVLSRTSLRFGSVGGTTTKTQSVLISDGGTGTLHWTATPSAAWITAAPGSGTGTATITIGVDPTGLAAGSYSGTVAFTDPGAINSPQNVAVNLTVYGAAGSQPPFGDFATPIDGTINVTGAIPVTGWALDDIGMEKVEIWRDPVLSAGEINALYFIGNGLFVEGPRPDIEAGYPNYPMNYAAGWGYMLLTNFLPNQGNGTYKLYAIATDKEGNQVTLGTKTITCDNAHATKPFGTIDTPGQGGTASGSAFINFGWVLTPLPGTVPKDGHLITVYVDSVLRGNLSTPPNLYNAYRPDVSTNFPGLNNTGGPGAGQGGPVGASYIDTTGFANGVHTIFWIAYDDLGRGDGIGSRFFSIANVAGAPEPEPAAQEAAPGELSNLPLSFSPILVKTGYDLDAEFLLRHPDKDGIVQIDIPEVNRVEIDLGYGDKSSALAPGGSRFGGHLVIGDELRPLPVGSTLDRRTGRFSWMPGPGFLGSYELVILKTEKTGGTSIHRLRISIKPK